MQNNITFKNLSSIGFSNYRLYADGKLYREDTDELKEIRADKINRFYLTAKNGTAERVTQKVLYRKVFNKEFCVDNI